MNKPRSNQRPAPLANSRTDAIRDVNDALAQEEFQQNIKSVLPALIAAALILVLGAGVTEIYKHFNHKNSRANTALLIDMVSAPDASAIKPDELTGFHRALALLTAAGKSENKADLYAQIAADKKVPEEFRDLGLVLSVQAQLGKEGVDAQKLLADITPIATKKKSPWQAQALLTSALIKSDMPNGKEAAIKELAQVEQLPSASPSITQTAKDLMEVYKQSQ